MWNADLQIYFPVWQLQQYEHELEKICNPYATYSSQFLNYLSNFAI